MSIRGGASGYQSSSSAARSGTSRVGAINIAALTIRINKIFMQYGSKIDKLWNQTLSGYA